MTTPIYPDRLSDIHRAHHATALALARRLREQGDMAGWARMLALAARSRFYFATLRSMGE